MTTHAVLSLWRFDTVDGADEAIRTLLRHWREGAGAMADVASVSWPAEERAPRIKRFASGRDTPVLDGAFWGMLIGLVFFVPLLHAAVGTGRTVSAGPLADLGIDDVFINKVRDRVTPGTSALFVIACETTADIFFDTLLDAVAAAESPERVSIELTAEQAASIRSVFEQDVGTGP